MVAEAVNGCDAVISCCVRCVLRRRSSLCPHVTVTRVAMCAYVRQRVCNGKCIITVPMPRLTCPLMTAQQLRCLHACLLVLAVPRHTACSCHLSTASCGLRMSCAITANRLHRGTQQFERSQGAAAAAVTHAHQRPTGSNTTHKNTHSSHQ